MPVLATASRIIYRARVSMSHPSSYVGTTARMPSSSIARRAYLYLPPQTITAESMMPSRGISPSRRAAGALSPTVAFPRIFPPPTTTAGPADSAADSPFSGVAQPVPPRKRPHALSLIRLSTKVAHAVVPSKPSLRTAPKAPPKSKPPKPSSIMRFSAPAPPSVRVVRRTLATQIFEPEGSSGPDTDFDGEPDLDTGPAARELDSDDDGTLVGSSAGAEGDFSPPWHAHKHLPKLPMMAIVAEAEEGIDPDTLPLPLSLPVPLPLPLPASLRTRVQQQQEPSSTGHPPPLSAGFSRKIVQYVFDDPPTPSSSSIPDLGAGTPSDAGSSKGSPGHSEIGAQLATRQNSSDGTCESLCPRWLLEFTHPSIPDFVIEVEDRAIVYCTALGPPPWHNRRRKGGEKGAGEKGAAAASESPGARNEPQ